MRKLLIRSHTGDVHYFNYRFVVMEGISVVCAPIDEFTHRMETLDYSDESQFLEIWHWNNKLCVYNLLGTLCLLRPVTNSDSEHPQKNK